MASRITGRSAVDPRVDPPWASADRTASHRRVQGRPPSGRIVISRWPVVVGVGLQPQVQRIPAQYRRGRVPPLDQGHRTVLHQLGQPEVDDLVQVVEPVDVGVEQPAQPRSTDVRTGPVDRVVADQGERRAGDGLGHPEPGPEALGERGLSGPQVTGQ